MKKYLRFTILGLTVITMILQGCSPTPGTTNNSPAPQVQSQPIILKNPWTATAVFVEPAAAPQQAQAAEAAFDGLVWDDLNWDGLQDVNEPGLPKVTVNLLNSSRTVAAKAHTDQDGLYRFEKLAPGDYYLAVAAPAGYVLSPQDKGENELVDSDNDPIAAETTMVTLVAGENGLVWTTGMYSPTAPIQAEPGTVRPPPVNITVCVPGVYSLGGISTLQINQLAPNYCLHAFLRRHGFALGRIPAGVGSILSEVTFVEVFYQNTFVYRYDVPGETNSIQVCYSVPGGKQAQIYFFDHYGPRFGQPPAGQPAWQPLPTTIDPETETACAVAQTSGAYALIGK